MGKKRYDISTVEVSDPPEGWTERDLERIQLKYRTLQKGYKGADAIDTMNLNSDEEQKYCQTLVDGAFQLLRLQPADYPDCFKACVSKCIDTRALKAHKWSYWGGYKDVYVKIKGIVDASEQQGKYHILPATSVVASIVVKCLRMIDTDGTDALTQQMIKYKVFEFAHASVKYFKEGGNMIMPTKHALPNWKPKDKSQIADKDKAGIPDDYNEMAITQSISRTSVEVDGTKKQAGIMLESEPSETPFYRPREATPWPTAITASKNITRAQAMQVITPYCSKIQKEIWSSAVNDEFAAVLSREIVIVLPNTYKKWLKTWSRQAGKPEIELWVKEATEDLETYEWDEPQLVQRQPQLSAREPIFMIIDELEEMQHNENVKGSEVHRKLRDGTAMIRRYILRMEEKWKARAYADVHKELYDGQIAIQTELSSIRRLLEENKDRRHRKRGYSHVSNMVDDAEAQANDNNAEAKVPDAMDEDMED
ncbi:hypothetical protein TrVGV298_012072 [Trichoderma virens]|nr:hypothetical protein TrVGV298_012072 [Trichoderma virens]